MDCKRGRLLSVGLVGSVLYLIIMFPTGLLSAQQNPSSEPAFRITGTLEDGKIVAITVNPLEVVLPLTIKEKILAQDEHPRGYFLEMLDDEEKVALRARFDDPTIVVMEYEDPEKLGNVISKTIHRDEVTFSIIVPAPRHARWVRFFRVQPGQKAIPLYERTHEELGSFRLPERETQAAPPVRGESL